MIAAVSHNGFLSALWGTRNPMRASSVGPAGGPRSDDSLKELSPTGPSNPIDTVEISALGRQLSEAQRPAEQLGQARSPLEAYRAAEPTQSDEVRLGHAETESARGGSEGGHANRSGARSLTSEEEGQVRELKERDSEVRRHEQAHKAAAGSLASGGPSFEYETGPDGKQYAVGGELNIDTSAVPGDPQATIAKMQQIRQAAMAPANPSSQDRSVAAEAGSIEQKARAELAAERVEAEDVAVAGAAGSHAATKSTEVRSAAKSSPGSAFYSPDRTHPALTARPGSLLDILV